MSLLRRSGPFSCWPLSQGRPAWGFPGPLARTLPKVELAHH